MMITLGGQFSPFNDILDSCLKMNPKDRFLDLMKFKSRSKHPNYVASYLSDDMLAQVMRFCADHDCGKSEAIRLLMQNGLAAMLLDDG